MSTPANDKPANRQNRDPLRRPDDWKDDTAFFAQLDRSRIRKYRTDDGLEYWVEPYGPKILTSDPSIFISFHGWSPREGRKLGLSYSYAVLHFDGTELLMTSSSPGPGEVRLEIDYSDCSPDGTKIWRIDDFPASFSVKDAESYPWVTLSHFLPEKVVQGLRRFESREQQERAIFLIRALMSCYNGSSLSALRGAAARGLVIFGNDLEKKLNDGNFIR